MTSLIKKISLLTILYLLSRPLYSQISAVNHWESVVLYNDTFKYQTNETAISEINWVQNSYDDSSWPETMGGIGYGDDDDNTVISGITSVFMRKEFNIVDTAEIASMILNIDYDDAFVAYLNGIEIGRSDGLNDLYPSYSALSSENHDAVIPSGGTPENYVVNYSTLKYLLVDGSNLLAIQVHNVSATSSDFSSNVWLSVGLNVETERYSSIPEWFSPPISGFSSNLPILDIETDGVTIVDEPKIDAYMGIIYNGEGELNYSDGAYTDYDGYIGIELRGNSTQDYDKKPYSIETRDELGENLNVSLLGLPKENDWVLRASYFDHTFARNPLADYMARKTGFWASNTRHVELILNGEYQGIYLLMEKIKRDNDRVDVAELDSSDISGEDLTGGYIWEITGFDPNIGERRKLKYPKYDEALPEQIAYITATDDAFRAKMAMNSDIYSDPDTGYVKHIWAKSFISEIIVQEALRNGDAYGWSAYFHKDKNGLINAGPVWDFDQSSGNSSYPDDGVVTGWMFEHESKSSTPFFWKRLYYDSFFKYSLSKQWNELRNDEFSNDSLFAYIDSIASLLSEAQEREFSKWPVLGQYIWRETTGYEDRDTYQKEVDYLKDILAQRWEWMDEELADINEPAGYPEISVTEGMEQMQAHINQEKVYVNLNDLFTYTYAPELEFDAHSCNKDIVKTDVKKSDSLKIKLKGIGTCDIILTATDTYGNTKNTTISFEVLDSIASNNDYTAYQDKLTIYPNPASDHINIYFSNVNSESVNIELYNCTGQLIKTIRQNFNNQTINYDCSQLNNGIYIIRLTTDDRSVFTQRFIITK